MYQAGPFTNLPRTSLHQDLQQYLCDQSLNHPLLQFEFVDPRLYSRLNQLYEHRLRVLTERLRDQNDWERLRPDLQRNDKINWLVRQVSKDESACRSQDQQVEFNRLLGQMWTDPEVVSHTSDVLLPCFRGELPSGPCLHFMVDTERIRLAELPEEVQVFRGHAPVTEHKPCWTLNPKVAVDWACKFDPGTFPTDQSPEYQFCAPILTVGTVRKSQIFAYVNRRNEDEILVHPEYVRDRTSYDVVKS